MCEQGHRPLGGRTQAGHPMTTEEAVERILLGSPFIGCMHCDKMGTTPASRERYKNAVLLYEQSTPKTRVQHPQVKDYTQLCMRCKGEGTTIEPSYAEACKVLGRALPKPRMNYEDL